MTSDLVTPRHLCRKAVIYIRQSTPHVAGVVTVTDPGHPLYGRRFALASATARSRRAWPGG